MRCREIDDDAFLPGVFPCGDTNRTDPIGGERGRRERTDHETVRYFSAQKLGNDLGLCDSRKEVGAGAGGRGQNSQARREAKEKAVQKMGDESGVGVAGKARSQLGHVDRG